MSTPRTLRATPLALVPFLLSGAGLTWACGAQLATDAPAGATTGSQEEKPAGQEAPKGIPDNADSSDPAVKALRAFIEEEKVKTEGEGWKLNLPMPPQLTFSEDQEYFWNLQTNKGVMIFKLMPQVAPMHVSSTLYLTELGFYDGTTFHRVIQGFMAQGGDPTGTGRGGPGYKYDGEVNEDVRHDRPGLLSMANTGAPTTDGSQFFLTFVPTPHLNMKHTIFGEIVEGRKTLKELERFGSPQGRTREPLILERATFSVRPKPEKQELGGEAEED